MKEDSRTSLHQNLVQYVRKNEWMEITQRMVDDVDQDMLCHIHQEDDEEGYTLLELFAESKAGRKFIKYWVIKNLQIIIEVALNRSYQTEAGDTLSPLFCLCIDEEASKILYHIIYHNPGIIRPCALNQPVGERYGYHTPLSLLARNEQGRAILLYIAQTYPGTIMQQGLDNNVLVKGSTLSPAVSIEDTIMPTIALLSMTEIGIQVLEAVVATNAGVISSLAIESLRKINFSAADRLLRMVDFAIARVANPEPVCPSFKELSEKDLLKIQKYSPVLHEQLRLDHMGINPFMGYPFGK